MIKKILYCFANLAILAVSVYGLVSYILSLVADLQAGEPVGTILLDILFLVLFFVLAIFWIIYLFLKLRRLITDIKINKENK